MIAYTCINCAKSREVPDEWSGRMVTCKCGTKGVIPAPAPANVPVNNERQIVRDRSRGWFVPAAILLSFAFGATAGVFAGRSVFENPPKTVEVVKYVDRPVIEAPKPVPKIEKPKEEPILAARTDEQKETIEFCREYLPFVKELQEAYEAVGNSDLKYEQDRHAIIHKHGELKTKFDQLSLPKSDKNKRSRNSIANALGDMRQLYSDVRGAQTTMHIEEARTYARRHAEECMELKDRFTREIEKIERTSR